MLNFAKSKFILLGIWALIFDVLYRFYSIFLLPKILSSSFYLAGSNLAREFTTSIYLVFELASSVLWGAFFIGFALRVVGLLEDRNQKK